MTVVKLRPKRNTGKTGAGKPRVTKKARLIRMLSGKNGADIDVLCDELGWKPNTIRAAIAGLRNVGYAIEKDPPEPGKPTSFRVIAAPESPETDAAPAVTSDAG